MARAKRAPKIEKKDIEAALRYEIGGGGDVKVLFLEVSKIFWLDREPNAYALCIYTNQYGLGSYLGELWYDKDDKSWCVNNGTDFETSPDLSNLTALSEIFKNINFDVVKALYATGETKV